MHGATHVAKSVDLDDVAELGVDDEAACDEIVVENEVGDREALAQQRRLGVFEDALLEELHLVIYQRVVHIVPDGLDGAHVEGARAEDAALRQRIGPVGREAVTRHKLTNL